MRDNEGVIATDNENVEYRESVAELIASAVGIYRSFGPFFQNKKHKTGYKLFLNEKISLLKCYEDIVLAPLKKVMREQDTKIKEKEALEKEIKKTMKHWRLKNQN